VAALTVAGLLAVSPLDAQERSASGSFAIEAVGGALGSAVGVGVGLLITDPGNCDGEDIQCILEGLGITGLIAAAGAPVGTLLAGKAWDTEPSLLGAVLGSIAGVAVGLGVIKLFDEAGVPLEGFGAGVTFALSHGVVTALGSRWLAALR
jgi:hypothetical protein